MTHRIRHLVTSLLPALALALAAGSAQGADDALWSVQLLIESTPDGFELKEQYVAQCGSPDWKQGGGEIIVEVVDAESIASQITMIDPRMVFVEPPDEEKWFGAPLVQVGDRYMFPNGTHVLAVPLGDGQVPALPARLKLESSAGDLFFETDITEDDMVPADYLGCGYILPPPPGR